MTRFTEPVWYLSPALASAQCQDSWRWQPTVTCLTVLQSAEQFVLAIRCYNFIFFPPTHETMNYFVWNKEQRPYIANKSILLANNSASLIFVKSSHNVWKVVPEKLVHISLLFFRRVFGDSMNFSLLKIQGCKGQRTFSYANTHFWMTWHKLQYLRCQLSPVWDSWK